MSHISNIQRIRTLLGGLDDAKSQRILTQCFELLAQGLGVHLHEIEETLEDLAYATFFHSTTQTIPDGVFTTVQFDSIEDNVGGFAFNPDGDLVLSTAGIYLLSLNVTWASNIVGLRELRFIGNTAAVGSAHPRVRVNDPPTGVVNQILTTPTRFVTANTTIQPAVLQTSGGDLDIGGVNTASRSTLRVVRLTPGVL